MNNSSDNITLDSLPYDLIMIKTNYNGYIIYLIGYLISENPEYLEISYKLIHENNLLENAITETIMVERILERQVIKLKDGKQTV